MSMRNKKKSYQIDLVWIKNIVSLIRLVNQQYMIYKSTHQGNQKRKGHIYVWLRI